MCALKLSHKCIFFPRPDRCYDSFGRIWIGRSLGLSDITDVLVTARPRWFGCFCVMFCIISKNVSFDFWSSNWMKSELTQNHLTFILRRAAWLKPPDSAVLYLSWGTTFKRRCGSISTSNNEEVTQNYEQPVLMLTSVSIQVLLQKLIDFFWLKSAEEVICFLLVCFPGDS